MLCNDIRQQRDAIASLKAEWAKLESPKRLQELASRHLSLRPIEAIQYDALKNLPRRVRRASSSRTIPIRSAP